MTNTDHAPLTLTTRPNGVSIATDEAGNILGKITPVGRSFRAARKWSATDDWRRVSTFRSVEAAHAWINKGHRSQDEANAAALAVGL